MADPIIFHIDVNSAFLSWSAAYRCCVLGEQHDLRKVPSVVAGQKDSRRSIVLAKSTPAKKFGIQTGEPLGMAKEKCPGLEVVEPDYEIYLAASRKMMALLRSVSPAVEQFSIDEAWVDMTGTERLYGSPVLAAVWLKERIKKELGFTVNIGVSCNKLLAKMAGELKKPDQVITLFPWEVEQKMWPLPVGELFFVGHATERKLLRMGIETIGELAAADPIELRRKLHKHGEAVWHLANGRNTDPVQPEREEQKGYGNAMTTPWDVTEPVFGQRILLTLCETVAARMRADEQLGKCITVSIRTAQFAGKSAQRQLPSASNGTAEIYEAACRVFMELWDGVTPLRQLGVQLSKVSHEPYRQYSLYDSVRFDKLEKLDAAVDRIRKKYGDQAIRRASVLNFENPREGAQKVAFRVRL